MEQIILDKMANEFRDKIDKDLKIKLSKLTAFYQKVPDRSLSIDVLKRFMKPVDLKNLIDDYVVERNSYKLKRTNLMN